MCVCSRNDVTNTYVWYLSGPKMPSHIWNCSASEFYVLHLSEGLVSNKLLPMMEIHWTMKSVLHGIVRRCVLLSPGEAQIQIQYKQQHKFKQLKLKHKLKHTNTNSNTNANTNGLPVCLAGIRGGGCSDQGSLVSTTNFSTECPNDQLMVSTSALCGDKYKWKIHCEYKFNTYTLYKHIFRDSLQTTFEQPIYLLKSPLKGSLS